MKQVKQTQSVLRKRKLMLVLPVLVVPFLTMAFWSLGGGKGNRPPTNAVSEGLNPNLPDALQKEEKILDKLGFYNKADQDSAKLAELMRSDPYYNVKEENGEFPPADELGELTESTATKYNQRLNLSPYEQPKRRSEDEVMRKLSLLQQQLESNATVSYSDEELPSASNPAFADEVGRLETMMKKMSEGSSEDPEIKQLSNVMDKLLDLRHPDRVKQRINEKENEVLSEVFPVLSSSGTDTTVNGFFGSDPHLVAKLSNAIEAVVNENQILTNGAVIKLRLLQDIYINGSKIPEGNFVFGVVSLDGERLQIDISSIRSGNSLYPVKLEVYDMDGLSGIYIPGAITRDVVKQSADNSLQLMELSTFDPSLKTQAAAAGINTIKSLLSRKVKLVKVMVKSGYRVLLQSKV